MRSKRDPALRRAWHDRHESDTVVRQDMGRACRDRAQRRDGPALHRPAPGERSDQSASVRGAADGGRSEEHTSELQSLMRISYAVFCLKNKTKTRQHKIK